ncbi:MAG: Ribosomal protein S27a [Candidatus Parvarchaeum acidophilus ARMAN-5]|jgi:small subunit ribosomal protein S27Ae|uniref:Small ribosomal subunit protein eS31 n=1 Tax=Candidatus Parvarchaeum acidophilus ARMAN-5 TaxID=662762 RepID=D6GUH7_PARA5|nr:MAG: Ribosomal protein S27a [Candidatus Parvarchaeum acidophilus ARMAN-5]
MEKKKQKSNEIWKLYKVEKGVLTRTNSTCPKCGAGTFLANHGDRLTCGHCGYSEFKKKSK